MSDSQKYWTYGEAKDKIREDLDLQEEDPDEEFITSTEMIGFFNEGIDFAEGEVTKIDEDYFLAYDFVPLETGEDTYDMPRNILGRKLRGVTFVSGTTRYQLQKYRRMNKFMNILEDEIAASSTAPYRYYLLNNDPTEGTKFVIVPPARETAVLAPETPESHPMKRWYLRQANRIPLPGVFTNPENIMATAVDIVNDQITVDPLVPYVTGDEVQVAIEGTSTLPAELAEATSYYVIRVSDAVIKLATTLALARAGTQIDLTTPGTGYFTMTVAATDAIIDATVLDIPEFHLFIMEWVKANCLLEDGDPRITGIVSKLETLRTQIVETLTDSEPDDDNTMESDMSIYDEMN